MKNVKMLQSYNVTSAKPQFPFNDVTFLTFVTSAKP